MNNIASVAGRFGLSLIFILSGFAKLGAGYAGTQGYMKLRKPMDAPVIVLVPGFAGRWFLQVDEDLPKARVYRID
ncbi:MAG: hypothetical protein NT117_01830 [Gammaproteobacteria bacterium]|nr:hypothetical protein [Gammaproteobacteria bacterium]